MCGVYAVLAPPGAPGDPQAVAAVRRLAHRGPQAQGTCYVGLRSATVTLGMSRLKVVDQSDFPVPYDFRQAHGIILAFNGEIFNWRALRRELAGPWQTDCDAEVVAAAWRAWGPASLSRFNGMWAFALVDVQEEQVFVSRDRAGEKPLYWQQSADSLYLASEIKALPGPWREARCADVEVLEFDCQVETPFAGVCAVPPGSWAKLAPGEELQPVTWWELPTARLDEGEAAWAETVDEAEAVLADAIDLRVTAEVPVAVQLSGGLDSALIQAHAPQERLYCVTFPAEGLDNEFLAQQAARGRPVRSVTFARAALDRELERIAYYLDTPATWTAVCQWFMNQQIAQEGGVVVLSGEGADELFGGYARYRVLYWLERLQQDPRLVDYQPLLRRALGQLPADALARLLNRGGDGLRAQAQALVAQYACPGHGLVSTMARTDFYTTMQVLLRMADRMAAAWSLENRSPFLDYRLMELAARLPEAWLVTEAGSKPVLREIARRWGVPESIVGEKTKRGLCLPSGWGVGATWDRRWFAELMQQAWRASFGLEEQSRGPGARAESLPRNNEGKLELRC